MAVKAAPDSLATFIWQDESCENVGTYRRGAYSAKQLEGTYKLVDFAELLTSTTVSDLNQYTDSYFEQAGKNLQHQYDSLATSLKQADVVPTAFWLNTRKLRTRELEEKYQRAKFALEGYYAPQSLRRNRYYSHCKDYAEALASLDTALVMQTWRKLIDEQKRNNDIPQMLEDRFAQESTSPDRMKYAKLELMTFGWYNCANAQRQYENLPERYQLQENYRRLFTSVKSECEDLD